MDHDIRAVIYAPGQHRVPWDGNTILKRCLTTSGAGPYSHHPSGMRGLTVGEYAVLQSYPQDHVFCGPRTQQVKQIGNSVPVSAAQVLFSSIKKDLEKGDGIVEPAIMIDSDDEGSQGTMKERSNNVKMTMKDRKMKDAKLGSNVEIKDIIVLDD
jgi:hypothetical protein